MPKRNRQTLKECFRQGKKPTELDFENLIDSTINILDDGFSKDIDTGIGLAPVQGKNVVMSVFRESGDNTPTWEMAVEAESGNLHIGRHGEEKTEPLIVLRNDGGIELGEEAHPLILNGMVRSSGRQGKITGSVPADGEWYPITDELEGCWALEVVAGCGRKNTGKHALLVATAVHCFGGHPKISRTRSHYGSWGNSIRLKWFKDGFSAQLCIKTRFDYGDGVMIRYHISHLWDKPFMENETGYM